MMKSPVYKLLSPAIRNPPPLGGAAQVREFRLRHADGRWLWVEGRGQALYRDAAGEPLVSAGTIADITRRTVSCTIRSCSRSG